MKTRWFWLLSLVLFLGFPALARVVSYAPYTNRPSVPAYQSRTAHWFVLQEGSHAYGLKNGGEVVLYDATGTEEPRIIHPRIQLKYTALYDRGTSPPVILLVGSSTSKISSDGGATWNPVTGVTRLSVPTRRESDVGGPFTYGLSEPVRIGNDAYPFLVATPFEGIVAVTPEGKAKAISPLRDLLGRDATGTRFVTRVEDSLAILDLDGRVTRVGPAGKYAEYSAWIAGDGSVYAVMRRLEGRFLFVYRNGKRQFIAGPSCCPPPDPDVPPNTSQPLKDFFAVPTHDYNGAWMIRKHAGGPTALLRHTLASGLETMWSDPKGPDVEALHAGRSGQSVLVQVHRERDVAIDEPFRDPALAVWRVGEGAPKEYDELFLNEEPTKQFVIVDPDRLAEGTPFVFDSGFTEEGVPPPPISAPGGGGGEVPQEWGVVRGSLKQHLVLPGVSRARGAFDSLWITDVVIYNPLEEWQEVAIEYVPLGGEPRAAAVRKATITLTSREIRQIGDVLGSLFGVDNGGGALHFHPEVAVNVTSRTYTHHGGGTVGYGMQAIDFFNAAGPRFPVSFAGAFPGKNFRTNLLLTDTSGRGTAAELTAGRYLGGTLSRLGVQAPVNGIGQTNGLGSVIPSAGEGGGLLIEPTRGTAIPTLVAIDNLSNDPTYFPPDLPGDIPRVIPIIGHVSGVNGAQFRTDLHLYNPAEDYRSVILEVFLWDGSSSWPLRQTIYLQARETRVIRDVMQSMFYTGGLGRLQYSTPETGQGVRVTSRTYHVNPSGATYGCLVPPLNNFQIAATGESLEILGVGGGSGFRTNLGLVDVSRTRGLNPRVRIHLRDAEGREHSFLAEVPSTGGTQINDIFAARGLSTPKAGLITVEVLSGMVGAYATLTDNITNDSTYLGAYLGARKD